MTILERLRAATGPDRELDLECWWWGKANHDGTREMEPEYKAVCLEQDDAPRYTSSMECALNLIPDDKYWLFAKGRTRPDEALYGFKIVAPDMKTITTISASEHENREICICIAALLARGVK